jgi:uncharacterized protein
VLIAATAHSAMSLVREHSHVDWRGVGWAMAGRLPGTVVGIWLVDSLSQKNFGLLVGTVVLGCVVLSLGFWRPAPTPRALVTAGVASGSFGTAMSVGGPVVGLLYQNSAGPQVRATMAAFFVLGSGASVIGLLVAGQVHARQLWTGLALIPFLIAGFLLSGPLRKRFDAGGIRTPVLIVSGLSAVVLIVRSVFA